MDVISLPGGKMRDMYRAFKAEFSTHPLPIDAVCVIGFNDVLKNGLFEAVGDLNEFQLLEALQADMEAAFSLLREEADRLAKAVLAPAPQGQVNSISFATLPVPPLLAWTDPADTQTARVGNLIRGAKIVLLNQLNQIFTELNQEVKASTAIDTTRAPSFRSWGLKRKATSKVFGPLTYQETAMGPFVHRLNQFRERRPEHKLHFDAYQKRKMARAVMRYFTSIYQVEQSVEMERS